MLGGNLDGGKLPPFIITFKGKNTRTGRIRKEIEKKDGFPGDIKYGVQDRIWMDEPLMLEWIEKIWKPAVKDNKQTYLIMDECRTHLATSVWKAFADCCTEIDLIPGGFTSKLQPMDVEINKPFKNFICAHFHDWLVANRMMRPSRLDIAGWVSGAWGNLSASVIRNSFRGAGLIVASSANDGHLENVDGDDDDSGDRSDDSIMED
jgi:DDE superfamily endonuclease